jgi:hypothetical protein
VKLGQLAASAAADAIRPPTCGRRPGRSAVMFAPATESPLPDGSIGYHIRRDDDCWTAALATLLQVSYDELPDACIDKRLALGQSPAEIDADAAGLEERWLAWRGLVLKFHTKLPPVPADRWIGVAPVEGQFQSHALVMAGDQVLFDPQRAATKALADALGVPGAAGVPRRFYPIEITHGYTIERKTD